LEAELAKEGIHIGLEKLEKICGLMKDRLVFMKDLKKETSFFFTTPSTYDEQVASTKWTADALTAAGTWLEALKGLSSFTAEEVKHQLHELLEAKAIKLGKVMQALRLAITGIGQGPDLMQIIEIIGKDETLKRLELAIKNLKVIA
jgi:glutamyl-tRNA synthetase